MRSHLWCLNGSEVALWLGVKSDIAAVKARFAIWVIDPGFTLCMHLLQSKRLAALRVTRQW